MPLSIFHSSPRLPSGSVRLCLVSQTMLRSPRYGVGGGCPSSDHTCHEDSFGSLWPSVGCKPSFFFRVADTPRGGAILTLFACSLPCSIMPCSSGTMGNVDPARWQVGHAVAELCRNQGLYPLVGLNTHGLCRALCFRLAGHSAHPMSTLHHWGAFRSPPVRTSCAMSSQALGDASSHSAHQK